jgi:hypothetical protein
MQVTKPRTVDIARSDTDGNSHAGRISNHHPVPGSIHPMTQSHLPAPVKCEEYFTGACSVTAKKLNIKVCHIEAGLRSGDMTMPE